MALTRSVTRRQFLARSTAIAVPLIIPATALGRGGAIAPSERIAVGCIGVGGRGGSNLRSFKGHPGSEIVGVCDVDAGHRARGLRAAGLKANAGYSDFRELLARKDIDAVMVATPDHWHAFITIAAAKAGKDVYCEKPLAASVAEGRAVASVIAKHKRVLQCGTQRRSNPNCRFACELVRNGRIGKLQRVEVGVPGKFAIRGGYTGLEKPQPIPAGFDYEMWLGSAPKAAYTAARCHFNFRWVLDYAPGYITDWGAHYLDIAQWGIGADDGGPVKIEAKNVASRKQGFYDAPESFRIEYTYANGVVAILTATNDNKAWGMKYIGEEGSVYVESARPVTTPANLVTTKIGKNEIHLYEASNHHGNFLECVKSRRTTSANAEIGHRSASICHIGTVATVFGRPLQWDPKAERFVGDDEANKRLVRPMRAPWTLGSV